MTIAYGVWAWREVKFRASPLTCVVALTTPTALPYECDIFLKALALNSEQIPLLHALHLEIFFFHL